MTPAGPRPTRIVIVGGGVCGTLTALHLMRSARRVEVTLLDRAGRHARGLAYSTEEPVHLLNVPVGRMSAWPDAPDDLLRWAQGQGLAATPATFLPRRVYGRYLADRLAEAGVAQGSRLVLAHAEAHDVVPQPGGLRVLLQGGTHLDAEHVVLAWGNLPPQDPLAHVGGDTLDARRYARDAWGATTLADLDPRAEVLLLGTGLTAVDALLALRHATHQGTVHALSRRGLVPQPQDAGSRVYGGGYDPAPVLEAAGDLRRLVRTVRAQCRLQRERGGDWRDVIAALRPGTPRLWASLSAPDRARFLRHVRPFWDTHRHRMAGTVDDAVATLWGTGAFQPKAGRVLRFEPTPSGVRVVWRPRGSDGTEVLEVARIVNATGPSPDLRKATDPLVRALLARGLLAPDALGLGACCGADGAVEGTHAPRPARLWTLGATRVGRLWESTAVPELRVQARDLAAAILSDTILTGADAERVAPRPT
jgi:uncharacterized NAD(P)/FAD-binding protein YdhS